MDNEDAVEHQPNDNRDQFDEMRALMNEQRAQMAAQQTTLAQLTHRIGQLNNVRYLPGSQAPLEKTRLLEIAEATMLFPDNMLDVVPKQDFVEDLQPESPHFVSREVQRGWQMFLSAYEKISETTDLALWFERFHHACDAQRIPYQRRFFHLNSKLMVESLYSKYINEVTDIINPADRAMEKVAAIEQWLYEPVVGRTRIQAAVRKIHAWKPSAKFTGFEQCYKDFRATINEYKTQIRYAVAHGIDALEILQTLPTELKLVRIFIERIKTPSLITEMQKVSSRKNLAILRLLCRSYDKEQTRELGFIGTPTTRARVNWIEPETKAEVNAIQTDLDEPVGDFERAAEVAEILWFQRGNRGGNGWNNRSQRRPFPRQEFRRRYDNRRRDDRRGSWNRTANQSGPRYGNGHFKTNSSGNSRQRQRALLDCLNCGRRGHVSSVCYQEQLCQICESTDHDMGKCPSIVCKLCNGHHVKRFCPKNPKNADQVNIIDALWSPTERPECIVIQNQENQENAPLSAAELNYMDQTEQEHTALHWQNPPCPRQD